MEGSLEGVPVTVTVPNTKRDFVANENENNATMAITNIRMLEFFSGIGGMRISVENALNLLNNQAGNQESYVLESCRAYDISLHANNVYNHNFCGDNKDGHTVCTKLVEQLKPKDILPLRANLWTMSPPCQPFTTNGEGRGKQRLDATDKRCNGLKGIANLLSTLKKEKRPKWILLENVKGFAESAMCEIWCECLRNNGYSYRSFILSPVEFGIPNHRTRFYLLAELDSKRWLNDPENKNIDGKHETVDSEVDNRQLQVPIAHGISSLTFCHEISKRPIYKVERYIGDTTSLDPYLVPMKVLLKAWSKGLGVVSERDKATHCFTAGYGRIYHRSTGSLLLIPGSKADVERQGAALEALPLDRSDMTIYENQLRRFQPEELLRLFGFVQVEDGANDQTTAFEIPSSVVPSLEQRYKLIGNSISVNVVTELLRELLSSA